MRMLSILAALLLMLASHASFQVNQAHAWCCGCGLCLPIQGCECPGQGGCPFCNESSKESTSFPYTTDNLNSSVVLDKDIERLARSITKLFSTDGLITSMRGKECLRDRIALSLLGATWNRSETASTFR